MTLTLTFNPMQATVMTYSHTKVQGQRSIGSEARLETNRRTDRGEHITSLANAVGNKQETLTAYYITALKSAVYATSTLYAQLLITCSTYKQLKFLLAFRMQASDFRVIDSLCYKAVHLKTSQNNDIKHPTVSM